jgi:uncharacterized protein (TIGR02145 family)
LICLSCSDESTSPDDDKETGTMTDIDGNVYKTVKIGTQWWMAENLKVTHYQNGDGIPNVNSSFYWQNLISGAYCIYDNNESNAQIYGLLYNWYAGDDERIIAPEGWHVPSENEWITLVDYLGGFGYAGGKMKENGTAHWLSPNTGANNESGFTALPGGVYSAGSGYLGITGSSFFLSSTGDDERGFWCLHLSYLYERLAGETWPKNSGVSIRCVKDN